MATASSAPRFLFATGGTGGHIYPALAVAQEAQRAGAHVRFMGQQGGMEERLIPEAGFEFHGVSAGKWDRSAPDPRQAVRAVQGLWGAVSNVRRNKPDLVVGFGGFASFPGCVAAVTNRVPLVLQEGNAFPSRVNRWFAPRARLVISTHAEALAHLRARRTEVIPFPIREARLDRHEARARLGLPQEAVVTLVMGGSQGSLVLNRAVPAAFEQLSPAQRPVVLHSSGPRWQEELTARVKEHADYHVRGYVDAVAAWSAADLAITRAGVGTLSEAAFHGVPLLMVPLPTAAENHQLHNAQAVATAGAGLVLEERELTERPERLAEVWLAALEPEWRHGARSAARARSPEGAAARIYTALRGELGT
ncbi:MAG: undecaprenyldiphospho-muramoylpentapeptide beta-N-acetylglucosaminyltransferase [Trueperaceae bacterium]